MNTDPGWGPAIKYGFLAIFARPRLMRVRPAITAARAGVLGPIITGVVLGSVLTNLGESEEGDSIFAGLVMSLAIVCSAAAILFFTYKTPIRAQPPVAMFLVVATISSALGSVPVLIGFVLFFLGGSYLIYGVGLLVSMVLLLGPARPTEAMAERIAQRLDPPIPSAQLWNALLDPLG